MARRIFPFFPSRAILLALFLIAVPLLAQEPAPPTPINATMVESRLQAIQADTNLDEATKTKTTEILTQASESLRVLGEWQATSNQYSELQKGAEATIKSLQDELAIPLPSTIEDVAPDTPSSELEFRLTDTEGRYTEAQTAMNALAQEAAHRSERRRQIPDLQAAARQRLTEAQAQLDGAPSTTEAPEIQEARRMAAEARKLAAQQELNAYELELQTFDVRGRILALRLDLATRLADQLKRDAAQLRDRLTARRQEEAVEAAARAREALLAANNAPEEIRALAGELAEENASLTLERTGPNGLLRRLEKAGNRLTQVKQDLTELSSNFATLKSKVDAAGLGTGTGALLRSHQRKLADARQLERNIWARQQEIAQIQIEEINAEEKRRELANIDKLVQSVLDDLPADTTDKQKSDFDKVLRTLYEAQREVLDDQLIDYENYFARLIDLDAQEQQLIAQTDEFQNYITERVLWLRSGELVGIGDVRSTYVAFTWLAGQENLMALAEALSNDFATSTLPVLCYTFIILILNALRWHLRRRIAASAEVASKRGCMDLRPTVDATVYSLLVSVGLPLLIGFVGWRCSVSLASTDYTRAVGGALVTSALFMWSLELPREIIRRNGLGIAHFEWSENSCRAVAWQLLTLEFFAIPLVAFIAFFELQAEQHWQETAGRLALILLLALLAVFGHRLMRKRNGAVLEIIERARKRSNLHLRRLWYALAVFTPIFLLLAAAYGYNYSALQIATQLHYTLFCAFILVVAAHLVMRWLLIARRQLARARARKKLEAIRTSTSDTETPAPPPAEEELDLGKIDTQAMRLIRSAFALSLAACAWFIWADDLPALSVLNHVELWTVTDTITKETEDGAGNIVVDSREEQVPITLRHVAAFLFIAGITFIAVQNLPGLLEILLWQRLSLMAGERYAANTIITYVLTLMGGTWAFSAVGLSWGKLQWLFAAVGLGLGFGLQEIFANLVSGIILLFERPVRVGDVVTVGGVSGTVSRIRIRATWITTFNRQELIVPNKEFVTGQLINWTLSDRVIRVELPVGIAYGSDVALAKRLMLELAQSNEFVAADPEPVVYFLGFGASSLDFELRAHCSEMDNALTLKDQLLCGIDDAFRAHNIEIPFPQTDLNVRRIDEALRLEQVREPKQGRPTPPPEIIS